MEHDKQVENTRCHDSCYDLIRRIIYWEVLRLFRITIERLFFIAWDYLPLFPSWTKLGSSVSSEWLRVLFLNTWKKWLSVWKILLCVAFWKDQRRSLLFLLSALNSLNKWKVLWKSKEISKGVFLFLQVQLGHLLVTCMSLLEICFFFLD